MEIKRLDNTKIIITLESEEEAQAFWDFSNLTKESSLDQSARHGEISRQLDSWFVANGRPT